MRISAFSKFPGNHRGNQNERSTGNGVVYLRFFLFFITAAIVVKLPRSCDIGMNEHFIINLFDPEFS